MPQSVTLKAKGLYTLPNHLSEIPEGSASVADNVVVDRDGIYEPRRGLNLYNSQFSTTVNDDRVKQLISYKGRLIAHYDSTLYIDSYPTVGVSWTSLLDNNNTTQTVAEASGRLKSIELNSNLYFTSSNGVRKLSAANATSISTSKVTYAGTSKALDVQLALNPASQYIDSASWQASVSVISAPSTNIQITYTTANTTNKFAIGDTVLFNHQSGTISPSLDGLKGTIYAIDSGTMMKVSVIGGPFSGGPATYNVIGYETPTYAWLEPSNTVAYRVLWVLKDAAGNYIYGAPSDNIQIKNTYTDPLTQSSTVNLTISIPDNITTDYAYQIYRSAQTASDEAGDELRLVMEGNPTSGEITARKLTVEDIQPETLRASGANLYTNENTGEGIAQSNYPPPFANDLAIFRDSAFYANTKGRQYKTITLQGMDGITAKGGTVNTVIVVPFVGPSPDFVYLTFDQDHHFTVGDNITTILGSYTVGMVSTSKMIVIFDYGHLGSGVWSAVTYAYSSANTTLTINAVQFRFMNGFENESLRYINKSTNASVSTAVDETARSIVRIVNRASTSPVNAFYLGADTEGVLGQILFEADDINDPAFTLISTAASNVFSPSLVSSVTSDQDVNPNRLYYSKTQQPEAVPLLNYIDIGPRDKAIVRIAALRDSLFIFKEDGTYRLSGNNTADFSVQMFDSNTTIKAPDSVVALNNLIYIFADQGITTVSDTGSSVISRSIENLLLPLMQLSNFEYNTFAVGYDTDRAYLLFTVTESTDTYPTQCFRFNTFTNAWTRFTISNTCGIIGDDDKLYLGSSDLEYVERERKSFTRYDYADRQFDVTVQYGNISGNEVILSSAETENIDVGDVLTQDQTVTIEMFNRMLKHLDSCALEDSDYYSTLFASSGDSLKDKFILLNAKLAADSEIGFNAAFSTHPSDFYQNADADTPTNHKTFFNKLIDYFTSAATIPVIYQDARPTQFGQWYRADNTITFESPLDGVDKSTGVITTKYTIPFISGSATIYRHIKSIVTYNPQHYGDPSLLKHTREATIMFENLNFTSATATYSTDLSSGEEEVDFVLEGTGGFGQFEWGGRNWGGDGTARPFRTLIPREKQRCRYITPKYTHNTALEKYAILGVSFTFEPTSSRGYR